MDKVEREALQVSKEIAVKFIETQRIMPSNFAEIFPSIHKVVLNTILEGCTRVAEHLDAEHLDAKLDKEKRG